MKLEPVVITMGDTDVSILCRPHTKDARILEEVVHKQCYRHTRVPFGVEPKERWLDLGAHIGAFACHCCKYGGSVYCFEPDKENYTILRKNLVRMNRALCRFQGRCEQAVYSCFPDPQLPLLTPTSRREGEIPNTKYSIFPMKSYQPLGQVTNYQFSPETTEGFQGIKMDIEGAEHGILDNLLDSPPSTDIQKMVIEYHFTKDRSMQHFKRRMDNLREYFTTVRYPPHLDRFLAEGKAEYPGYFDRLIFCVR